MCGRFVASAHRLAIKMQYPQFSTAHDMDTSLHSAAEFLKNQLK
jgi:hypothetical protein